MNFQGDPHFPDQWNAALNALHYFAPNIPIPQLNNLLHKYWLPANIPLSLNNLLNNPMIRQNMSQWLMALYELSYNFPTVDSLQLTDILQQVWNPDNSDESLRQASITLRNSLQY